MPNLEIEFPNATGSHSLPGFRLLRLEMLNWGTFHGKVQIVRPEGGWSLLVGLNGSGKSTAVDAMRTLLVPPRLLNYNDASGEQKRRDRTRKSYIRGVWASSSDNDSGDVKAEALRKEGEYSILLGVFQNQFTSAEVTLAQVLYEHGDQITDVFVVALGDRSIAAHLSELGDARKLKKTLKDRRFESFDSFSGYAERFRPLMGIPGEAALEVFNQAIGVKEVSDVNSFIRKHMLEGSDAIDFIRNTLQPHCKELSDCWEAILKARRQVNQLEPIVSEHTRKSEAQSKKTALEQLQELVPVYYDLKHKVLRDKEAERLRSVSAALEDELESTKARQAIDEKAHIELELQVDSNESERRIKELNLAIGEADLRKKPKEKLFNTVQASFTMLGIDGTINKAEELTSRQASAAAKQGLIEGSRVSYADKHQAQKDAQGEALKNVAIWTEELRSLQERKGNIPMDFLELRRQICGQAGVMPEELPFAGELIQVKDEYFEWTGAFEKLLHTFGISLLVPEKHYRAVAGYINRTRLSNSRGDGIRLNFLRVSTGKSDSALPQREDPNLVTSRVTYLPDHPYSAWVRQEARFRFRHLCCESVESLETTDYGLTKEGLYRNGTTHIKDDRRKLSDPSNYVLGWSNERKIAALKVNISDALQKAETAAKKVKELEQDLAKCDKQLQAIKDVMAVERFSDVDYQAENVLIYQFQSEIRALEESSDALKVLKGQLAEVKKRIAERKEVIQQLSMDYGASLKEIRSNLAIIDELEKGIPENAEESAEAIDEQIREIEPEGALTIANVASVSAAVGKKVSGRISQQSGIINSASTTMTRLMTDFLRDFPEFSSNHQAHPDSGEDFKNLLVRIQKEDLPKHEANFKRYLTKNLVGDVAMFKNRLENHEQSIFDRLEMVNRALKEIPFSPSTYVQIAATNLKSGDIPMFRARLRACISKGLNPEDESEREGIFQKIRELIEEFGKLPEWTKHVTDARNWLEFAIRELDDEGIEKNYWKASVGKSGGQKAKLAFTILASAIAAQYGLAMNKDNPNTFRLVVIDEAFARTDEENSKRALDLFKNLGLQLIIVSPYDAKARIVENYVETFHLVDNPKENNSKVRRASRADYDAARKNALALRSGNAES